MRHNGGKMSGKMSMCIFKKFVCAQASPFFSFAKKQLFQNIAIRSVLEKSV